MPDRVLGNTSSPSETIAKAMEGDMSTPLNAVDRLRMLAGGVNTHNLDMDDAEWILDALNELLPLALQLEAMKREMAEKDAEIARLRDALQFYATPSIYLPHPLGPAFDRRTSLYHSAKDALSGARTLIQGEKQ